MTCDKCNQLINPKANEVAITASTINMHIACAIELKRQNEYDDFIRSSLVAKRRKALAGKRFIKGLGYV